MLRVGIDTGGTFTDLVAYDSVAGTISIAKQPSTPGDASLAIIRGLAEAAVPLEQLDGIIIGTTVGTNAVLERAGASVLLITTAGFEDVLFIGRMDKERLYDLHWTKPRPLVTRAHCVGIRERLDHHGAELVPVDPESIGDAIALLREHGEVDAVAVCLLFSYINPAHEEAIGAALAAAYPELPVSLSSKISPVWREYERMSTTVADAYIKPVLQRYVWAVEKGLRSIGVTCPWNLLKSNGGYMSSTLAVERPVPLVLSGLAGGVIGARYYGQRAGAPNLFTLDMGGTSCDIGIIRDGQQLYANEFDIAFGIPITLPCVAVNTIGAGGGSIAWLDKGSFLHVGPQSAGAHPGPAAYGAGGSAPTVTDANLVLGRLNPAYFLGGKMTLDVARAGEAVAGLAATMGLELPDAAHAVIETTDENMANAIRLLAVERGFDVREFALMAFGGAGPVHARAVAEKLGIARVLVPLHPGLCSAFGALIADWRVDKVWTAFMRSDALDLPRVRAEFTRLEQEARDELLADGFTGEVLIARGIDMRYAGQNYEREVPLSGPAEHAGSIGEALARFAELHEAFYGFSIEGETIELVNFRLTAIGLAGVPDLPLLAPAQDAPLPIARRDVFFQAGGFTACPIYRRDDL
ncbi:MAG TPA: hydantoinase/oxoprolinase family protein, partial [Chloroflexota bacterium]|nr:hydantoinase/oxoprolinase family protein [Chloroflexota bacterium]